MNFHISKYIFDRDCTSIEDTYCEGRIAEQKSKLALNHFNDKNYQKSQQGQKCKDNKNSTNEKSSSFSSYNEGSHNSSNQGSRQKNAQFNKIQAVFDAKDPPATIPSPYYHSSSKNKDSLMMYPFFLKDIFINYCWIQELRSQ